MKKILIFITLTLFAAGAVFAQVSRGSNAWVNAKSVTVKSSTGFFASTRGKLTYGDQVAVVQVNGKYAEIRAANNAVSGWVAVANLSAKRIVASGSGSGASASEIALAGKGFNQEVENAYKAEGDLNYADVDKTEAVTVSQEDLYRFVTEGRLKAGE
ncbi:MAG: hypothetical protein LBC62_11275 [Treponema sp.]|jgi:hypothetical protein|nr:hypothetical protein [Treponema sp.]